ncbi:MAG: hypothetical protein GY835_23770 [bacterium]|nr:hypothetical protein [bacterium]
MDFSIEDITPEKAATLLKSNNRNRHVRRASVRGYCAEMIAGRWRVTHQAIAINSDGSLLDGQHRLHAIIMSGLTIRASVCRNADPQTLSCVDTQTERTGADAVYLEWGASDKRIAPTLKAMLQLSGTRARNGKLFNSKMSWLASRYLEHAKWVCRAVPRSKTNLHITAQVLSVVARARRTGEGEEVLLNFLEVLKTGMHGNEKGALTAVTFRDWLIRAAAVTPAPSPLCRARRAAFALRKYIDNTDTSRIAELKNDPWPLLGDQLIIGD